MSAAVECNGCGSIAKRPALKHKVQTRAAEGQIVHRDFCNDECLLLWVQTSISDRATRKAREVSEGVGVTPTPLAVPPRRAVPGVTAAMLAASAAEQAITAAAEQLPDDSAGRWAFSIVHGDVEDQDEQLALDQLSRLAHRTGHLVTVYGTNDTTAYVFDAAGGRLAVLALQGAALLFGRSWWRAHTRFGGDA